MTQHAFSDAELAAVRRRHAPQLRAAKFERLRLAAIALLMGAVAVFAPLYLEFSLGKIWNGLGKLGDFVVLMLPPAYGTEVRLSLYLKSLAETLAIAFLGTFGAALLALPLGFLAAKTVTASRIVRFLSRRSFDTVRGVDSLIWALIWINVVGLGPFAGVLAILTSDLGTFGKLFSEAIETSDRRPVEGVTAAGGGHTHAIRFGIIPQVLPLIASQALYYFESNTRSATIIGIVGAGGIGMHLAEQIRTLEWQHVSFLILLILATVAAIDWISSRLRLAIIGERAR